MKKKSFRKPFLFTGEVTLDGVVGESGYRSVLAAYAEYASGNAGGTGVGVCVVRHDKYLVGVITSFFPGVDPVAREFWIVNERYGAGRFEGFLVGRVRRNSVRSPLGN